MGVSRVRGGSTVFALFTPIGGLHARGGALAGGTGHVVVVGGGGVEVLLFEEWWGVVAAEHLAHCEVFVLLLFEDIVKLAFYWLVVGVKVVVLVSRLA